MAYKLEDQSKIKNCTLAFCMNREQWDRFYNLKKKGEIQSHLLRSILFDWMDKREQELKNG
jgi:hypothetical protein